MQLYFYVSCVNVLCFRVFEYLHVFIYLYGYSVGCFTVGSSPAAGRPCIHASTHIHHMGSRGAFRARPGHAYGPFSTHCFLLHGYTAFLPIHKSEVENFTVNRERLHRENRRIYKSVLIGIPTQFSICLLCWFLDTLDILYLNLSAVLRAVSVTCQS